MFSPAAGAQTANYVGSKSVSNLDSHSRPPSGERAFQREVSYASCLSGSQLERGSVSRSSVIRKVGVALVRKLELQATLLRVTDPRSDSIALCPWPCWSSRT